MASMRKPALAALLALTACTLPASRAPHGDVGAAAELALGHRLMAAGEHEQALAAFTRAAVDEGLTADVLAAMGEANLRLGRLGQAERLFRRALEQDARDFAVWNNLAVVLVEQGRLDEAIPIFETALRLAEEDGESAAVRENLNKTLELNGQSGYSGAAGEFRVVRPQAVRPAGGS